MNAPAPTGYSAPDTRAKSVMLPARPEPLRLKPSETAVIVVDMQNAYASPGGYIDIAGFDVSGAPSAIAKTKNVAGGGPRRRRRPSSFFRMAGTRTTWRRAPPDRRISINPMR